MSTIKGGGRAQLSSAAEEEIVSLLYDLRDKKNPLLPKKKKKRDRSNDTSSNDEISKDVRFHELSLHDQKK